MQTKPCPDCGTQVSQAARNCPNCRRFMTHRSVQIVVRGVFLWIIVQTMIFAALRS